MISIPGVKIINNIPYAVGVDAIQKVFEHYGIKKSKKATYKFTSKVGWKKRLKAQGKSLIAVPIPEIERWIEKNYPAIWNSKKSSDEKRLIAKNFSVIEGFEKIIDQIERRLDGKDNPLTNNNDYLPDIWRAEQEDERKYSIKNDSKNIKKGQESEILNKISELIDIFVNTPPSSIDNDTLSKVKDKLLCILNFVDSIYSINKWKSD